MRADLLDRADPIDLVDLHHALLLVVGDAGLGLLLVGVDPTLDHGGVGVVGAVLLLGAAHQAALQLLVRDAENDHARELRPAAGG